MVPFLIGRGTGKTIGAKMRLWTIIKQTIGSFITDRAMTHGAAIAYYTTFSLAPLLLIVIAIAGLMFGRDAVQGAILAEVRGLIGTESAGFLEQLIKSASNPGSGIVATVASGLIHSDDSQIARSSSNSRHESRNYRQRHSGGSPSA